MNRCNEDISIIAAWTTPTITYKPSLVDMENVVAIFCVIFHFDEEILRLDIEDATRTEDGFMWFLSQEDTSILADKSIVSIKIDYKTDTGMRCTTKKKDFSVVKSAVNEVI